MRRLHKFIYLSGSDRQLFLSTFVLLGLIRLGMRLLPFQSLANTLQAGVPKS